MLSTLSAVSPVIRLSQLTIALLLASPILLNGCGSDSSTHLNDTTPPTLSIATDIIDEVSRQSQLRITGQVSDNVQVASLSVQINETTEQPIDFNSDGSFTTTVRLHPGVNRIVITATDKMGNRDYKQGEVYFGQRLSAGAAHSMAIKSGRVYGWGRNNYAQTGIGKATQMGVDSDHPATPTQITNLPEHMVSVSINQNYAVALSSDGKVYTWGSDEEGQLGRGNTGRDACVGESNNCRFAADVVTGLPKAVAISAGGAHVLVLTEMGEVWAFGSNNQKQLGKDDIAHSDTPIQIDLTNSADANSMGRIIAIAASSDASFILDDQGQVWGWGSNENGTLGRGQVCDEYEPATTPDCIQSSATAHRVDLPSGVKISEIAAGGSHLLAKTTNGEVYGWGNNFSSQVGYRGVGYAYTDNEWDEVIDTPTLLPWSQQTPAKHIYAGGTTSYMMDNQAKVHAWGIFGENDKDDIPEYLELSTPTDKLPMLTQVDDMAVGALHQLAMRQDGGMFSWGWNAYGSLGGGADTSSFWMYNVPILLTLPAATSNQ